MSATIQIQSGIAAGTSYWIDRPVLRIGSDPQCEICLPSADLPPHALTLEFRGGSYRAYNRGSSPVQIGGTTLQPGGASAWDDGVAATLPGGVRLVMQHDGDPRPSPRPEARTDDAFGEEPAIEADASSTASPAAKTTNKKTLVQLAVIGLCIAATLAFMVMSRAQPEAPAANRPTFDAIVRASLTQDDKIRTFVHKLQFAQSFLVRGNNEIAKVLFYDLREQLVRQIDSLPAGDREFAKVIREYVETRLSQLQ